MLEGGTLHRLKVRWWKQKRGGGACAGKRGGGGVKPLGLGNVKGVFLVTVVGCAIAAVFAVLEFLYGTKLSGGDAGVSWVEEMISDLRFIMLCHGNTMKLAYETFLVDTGLGDNIFYNDFKNYTYWQKTAGSSTSGAYVTSSKSR